MTQAIIDIGDAPNDGTGDPARDAFNKCNNNFTELYAADAAGGGGIATPGPPQGRLTLQMATPVMTTTQAARTTIYYTPYVGNQVPIYDGSGFTMTSIGSELSVATTDTTKSPAAIGVSKVNDWFVWNDAGTIRLGHGPDWTSDTVRSAGTALVMVNGIWLNNAAITNGPAASRGTYVGTTCSNATSQLDWIYGAIAAGGTAGFFGLWNCYNRIRFGSLTGETTNSWTYATATIRAANNSATMRCSFVYGLNEEVVNSSYKLAVNSGAAVNGIIGVGLDTTTAFSGLPGWQALASNNVSTMGTYSGSPGLGFHYISANETVSTAVSCIFYGDNNNPGLFQGGLTVEIMA